MSGELESSYPMPGVDSEQSGSSKSNHQKTSEATEVNNQHPHKDSNEQEGGQKFPNIGEHEAQQGSDEGVTTTSTKATVQNIMEELKSNPVTTNNTSRAKENTPQQPTSSSSETRQPAWARFGDQVKAIREKQQQKLDQEKWSEIAKQKEQSLLEAKKIADKKREKARKTLQDMKLSNSSPKQSEYFQQRPSEQEQRTKLLEQQDAEYEASLAMDRKKEAEKVHELQKQEEARKLREAVLASLEPQPLPSGPDVHQFMLTMPDGSKLQRTFSSATSLSVLYTFVEAHCGLEQISISTHFPRKTVPRSDTTSMAQHFEEKRSTLFVEAVGL